MSTYYDRGYRKQGIIGWRKSWDQVYYFTFLVSAMTPDLTRSNVAEISAMMRNEETDLEEIDPHNIDEDGRPIRNRETEKQVDEIITRLRLRGWELSPVRGGHWFSYIFIIQ